MAEQKVSKGYMGAMWRGYLPIEVGDQCIELSGGAISTVVEVMLGSVAIAHGSTKKTLMPEALSYVMKGSDSELKDQTRWVRSNDPQCPLESVPGCLYPNGEFRTGPTKVYQKHEHFGNPGFLVVYLKSKALDFDETRATFEAILGSLTACFNYCGSKVPVIPVEVSSKDELEFHLRHQGLACSHVVLVGHGSRSGIEIFGSTVPAKDISELLDLFE